MLSDKEIIEGNRLIMESPFASDHHKEWIKKLIKFEGKPDTAFENARYHSDWNWIMPAWIKFRGLNLDLNGAYGEWLDSLGWYLYSSDEPKRFFERLVAAITWYNSLTTKQEGS